MLSAEAVKEMMCVIIIQLNMQCYVVQFAPSIFQIIKLYGPSTIFRWYLVLFCSFRGIKDPFHIFANEQVAMTTPILCQTCEVHHSTLIRYLMENLVESGCVFYRMWVGGREFSLQP